MRRGGKYDENDENIDDCRPFSLRAI